MDTEMDAVRDGAEEPWGLADAGPTLTGTIAAAIMGLPWAHAHPGSISDDDAGEMVADRYGQVQKIVDAAIGKFAAPSAAGGGEIPEGWALVPEEATGAMWQAGRDANEHSTGSYSAVWAAMVAAAPSPSQGGDTGEAGRDPKGSGHSRAEPCGLGPGAERLAALWTLCEAFITKQRVSCAEATVEDRVYENSPDLIEEIGKIVGFYQWPET